jgi:hypothetical protein
MARVVETVAADYPDAVRWEVVITKKIEGALRHGELSRQLGRPAPVPSIIIDGELAFETIPGTEELRARLERYLAKTDGDDGSNEMK